MRFILIGSMEVSGEVVRTTGKTMGQHGRKIFSFTVMRFGLSGSKNPGGIARILHANPSPTTE